jgi:monofunctional chorismate mutase
MIAIRGAIRVSRNDRDAIYRATQRLLGEIERRNDLSESQVISAFFTMTPDLDADFPAYAVRDMGWTNTAMLGAQETAVPGAMDRMIRVLLHVDSEGPASHVYLGEAAAMRPDLVEEGDALATAPSPALPSPRFGTLLVVGLGLIGGSAALALRRRGLFAEVVGYDVDEEALERARRAGAIARAAPSPESLLGSVDTVLLAVPVGALLAWLERWGGMLPRGAVVVDVGSTKRRIVQAMEGLAEGVQAVGAHPMAGSEQGGMGAARPDLFHGARWALVETDRTGERARRVAEALVEAVGGVPFWVGADRHDRATAATSHLPYLLSVALARHLEDRADDVPVGALLGPGARDMLRLAGSDPGVMGGILSTNWVEIRDEVARYRETLAGAMATLDGLLEAGSAHELRSALEELRESRERLLASAQADEEEET